MNNQIKLGIAAGLVVLAIVIIMLTRSSSSSYSADVSSQTPKPRAGSPTFAQPDPAYAGGRNKPGRSADSATPPVTP